MGLPQRLPRRTLARAAVGQRRIDRGVRSGSGLSTASGAAETETPEVPVDLAAR